MTEPFPSTRRVLLVHGIWNARSWLVPLARRLRAEGFEVEVFGRPRRSATASPTRTMRCGCWKTAASPSATPSPVPAAWPHPVRAGDGELKRLYERHGFEKVGETRDHEFILRRQARTA